jgi:predicted RNase H-like HicB family nuclease
MENTELDQLRSAYKEAVEFWIAAIRTEENLATPDHSVPAVDIWEHAGFDEEAARDKAKEARKAYEDALRKIDFNF